MRARIKEKKSAQIYSTITMALLTIETFFGTEFRELFENFLRIFTIFYRGTVDLRHMDVQVSRKGTKFYGAECSEVFF